MAARTARAPKGHGLHVRTEVAPRALGMNLHAAGRRRVPSQPERLAMAQRRLGRIARVVAFTKHGRKL
eukprot:4102619-Alexandrium_andersonii.AAC.1